MQGLIKWMFQIYIISQAFCFRLSFCVNNNSSNTINATMAIDCLLKQFDYLSLHLRSRSDASNYYVQYLLKQNVCPVYLSMGSIINENIFTTNQRHRSIVMASHELNATTYAKHVTKFGVLIYILLDEPDQDKLLTIVERMWTSDGIYRVYFITPTRSTWFNPFATNNGKYGMLTDMLATCSDGIFRNLNGYTLRTYIFDSVYSTAFASESTKKITSFSGADGKIAELLSKNLNFTMDLQWPDNEFFGARLPNGSYNGAIGRIIRAEIDISLTGFFVKDYLTREIEFSVAVYMDQLCCYVMKAKRIPSSILPLFVVDVSMWCAFLLVGFICSFIWMALRRANLFANIVAMNSPRFDIVHSAYTRIFVDTWVLWVRVNIKRFPPYHSERVFLISLCLVSVIIGAVFESSLATVYIRPLYYRDINTMQELDQANLKILIKHAAMKDDLFYGHTSAIYKSLDQKLQLVPETEERLISVMSKRGGFAAVTRASSLEMDDIYYIITKKIHKIPECPKNYHIAFVLPHHSPYERTINVMLLKFLAAGLIDHWINQMKHEAKIVIHTLPDYVAEFEYKWKVLTLNDLQLAFYALVFGCILGVLVFAKEFFLRKKL